MFRVIRETPTGVVPTGEAYENLDDAERAAEWHNAFSAEEGLRERYGVVYPGD